LLNIFNKSSAAKALNISVETLDRYTKSGKVPHRRIGNRVLFTECDLITFLDNCSIPATVLPTSRESHEMRKTAGGAA
jgi:excisionase family DNA binding protein